MARDKKSDIPAVTAAREEAAALVRLAAGPDQARDTIKTRIARAARNLGWQVARTRHVWNGEARLEVHEMDRLRRFALEEAVRRASFPRVTRS